MRCKVVLNFININMYIILVYDTFVCFCEERERERERVSTMYSCTSLPAMQCYEVTTTQVNL